MQMCTQAQNAIQLTKENGPAYQNSQFIHIKGIGTSLFQSLHKMVLKCNRTDRYTRHISYLHIFLQSKKKSDIKIQIKVGEIGRKRNKHDTLFTQVPLELHRNFTQVSYIYMLCVVHHNVTWLQINFRANSLYVRNIIIKI